MTVWNLAELKELCGAKNREYPSTYIESLPPKQIYSQLHAEEADRIWKELHSGSFTFGDEKYGRSFYLYQAHVEACVNALRSMIDYLLQTINVVLLKRDIPEKGVSIWGVRDRIDDSTKKNIEYKNVSNSLKLLIKDESFNYLNAFCIINKHHRSMSSSCQYHAEYGEGTRNENGIIFNSFNYENKDYPEMRANDIFEKIRTRIISLILLIGISINEDLKNIKN